jgi:glucose-1-phosphate cytidylyltransferase
MKVVILCGGLGSRIRDANEMLPKPMLPIGGKPIVWHIMKTYAHYGFKDFVLCLGYRAWSIKEFFVNYDAMTHDIIVHLGSQRSLSLLGDKGADDEWAVTLADTGEITNTGGRVLAVRRFVEGEGVFFLTYGDGVADIDIGKLLEFHRSHGRIATVTAVRPAGRFGELGLSGDAVVEFNEKPQASEGFINGGYFVCDAARIWDYLPAGSTTILEREPMQRLAAAGELVAFRHQGFWQPMDTLREYVLLNEMWDSGQAAWKVW